METKKKKRLPLETRINLWSLVPNLISAVVIFSFSVMASQVRSYIWQRTLVFIGPMVLILEFVFSPLIIHLIFSSRSRRLQDFYNRDTTVQERTSLFEDISGVPFLYSLVVFSFFFVGAILFFLLYLIGLHLNTNVAVLSFLSTIFGAFMAACIAFMYTRIMVSNDLFTIARKGIDLDQVYEKKIYGRSVAVQSYIFLVTPVILIGILCVYIVIVGYVPIRFGSQWPDEKTQVLRMLSVAGLCTFCYIVLTVLFNHQIQNNNKKMSESLESMMENAGKSVPIDTDLHDEISYSQFLANEMIGYLQRVLDKAVSTGLEIDSSSMELVKVSSETESTAVEQSTATNEIVSTMEEAGKLTKEVDVKIQQVSQISENTARTVRDGVQLLQDNLTKMNAIAQTNRDMVQGIEDVNKKIASIWDIISIINSIADNTKIIAFNAELEATNLHEKGRNFKNVANEVRRLANGTVDSTREIRERINHIQDATDSLLQSTERSSQKITEGISLVHSLESALSTIDVSARKTASSSAEIQSRISQETEAFNQIVLTLHQISRSIESFSSSTHTIMDTAFELQNNANNLATIINEGGDRA